DQKTTHSDQLVKQRARWINTWFKYFKVGINLFFYSIFKFDRNGFLFSFTQLRPPLFMLFTLAAICIFLNIIILPILNLMWLGCLLVFIFIFFEALSVFKAHKSMYSSLYRIPEFVFFQFLA